MSFPHRSPWTISRVFFFFVGHTTREFHRAASPDYTPLSGGNSNRQAQNDLPWGRTSGKSKQQLAEQNREADKCLVSKPWAQRTPRSEKVLETMGGLHRDYRKTTRLLQETLREDCAKTSRPKKGAENHCKPTRRNTSRQRVEGFMRLPGVVVSDFAPCPFQAPRVKGRVYPRREAIFLA